MSKQIQPVPPNYPPLPGKPLTHNEECAATGGRSYTAAPRRDITLPEPNRAKCPRINGAVCPTCYPNGEFG